jgi:hypothetical protein
MDNGYMDPCMDGHVNNEWVDDGLMESGWMDGWMKGWMDG